MVGALRGDFVTNLDECVPAVMGLRAHVRFRSPRDELSLIDECAETRQRSRGEFVGETGKNSGGALVPTSAWNARPASAEQVRAIEIQRR